MKKPKIDLETEAKKYTQSKRPRLIKPLTSRRYLAGQALAGILAGSKGALRMADVKRQAYEWADYMLDDEED
jgi:hypothetical protein